MTLVKLAFWFGLGCIIGACINWLSIKMQASLLIAETDKVLRHVSDTRNG